jgi:dsRNA-specific ribonuclease
MDTPISVLQELCSQHLEGMSPEYQLLSVEGVVHAPTFIYRVQIGDIVATARGQSKKKAKHAAALAALESLSGKYGDVPGLDFVMSSASTFVGDPQSEKQTEETGTGNECNPVGKLQEVCMKKRWRPPNYDTTQELGLPHERVFTMTCEIEHLKIHVKVKGTGRSKKLAKRNAAQEMLSKLEELGLFDPNTVSQNQSSQDHTTRQPRAEIPVPEVLTTNGVPVKENVERFFQSLGPDLNLELDTVVPVFDEDGLLASDADPDLDYCEALETVAEYTMCRSQYLKLPETKTETSKPQIRCLVHLIPGDSIPPNLPVITGWGLDSNYDGAKREAAKTALILLNHIRHCA